MNKVYIVHGWEGRPDEPALLWLKGKLQSLNYQVTVPSMPNPAKPTIASWIAKLDDISDLDEDTVLVGHSIGCQAILRFLETLPASVKIAGVVLLAPWMELDAQTIAEEGKEVRELARPWMETPIDWSKVRSHIDKAVAIFSDNDYYVPESQQQLFVDKLGADVIVEHDKGHFAVSDNTKELPSVLESVYNMKN